MCVVFIGSPKKADRLSKSKWQPVLIVMVCHVGRVSIRPNLISISSRVIDVNAFINADASRRL